MKKNCRGRCSRRPGTKKRILSLIMVLSMLCAFVPVVAQAATSGTCGDNLTWTLDDNGTLTISGTGDMTDWRSYEYVPWYSSESSIKSIIIKNGVTSIGTYAFLGCSNLTSVTISDSVTSIGDFAFDDCSGLTSVTIPDSVTSVGISAFANCSNLTDVYYSGSEEEWEKIVISSYNNPLTNATIHYNSTGGGTTVTPPPTVTFTPDLPTPAPSNGFQVNKYRTEYLLNESPDLSTMENVHFNWSSTPSKILYQAAIDGGVYWQASAWKAFTDTIDAVDSPSKLLDYSIEEKDMYSAIIFNMFESATDYKIMQCIDNEVTKNTKSLVSNVTSIMKNMYNYNFLDNYDISKMSAEEKANLKKAMDDSFKAEHGNAKDIGKLTSVISKAIDYAKDLQSCCEMISSYYEIYQMSDAVKQVMQEMYNKCPIEEKALRNALKDCVTMMNAGADEFANNMVDIFFSVAGKDATQYLIDTLWDKVKDKVYLAHPGAYVIMTAYKAGKYASNVLFNVDDITEKYFKLEAMVKSEQVLDSVYKSVKSKYKSNKTEEKAEVYNSAIDVMYNALNTDCDYALAYVNSVDSSTAGKINAALGDTSCSEMKKSIGSIQGGYASMHASILTGWIYELENDYSELYPQYEKLVDDTYDKVVKKYDIHCPVDVYIYDANGSLKAWVVNDVPYCDNDANFTIVVNGDEKTIYTYDDIDHSITYMGRDTGTMDIEISKYDKDLNEIRKVYYKDLELDNQSQYSIQYFEGEDIWMAQFGSGGSKNVVPIDYDTQVGGATYTANIERGYFDNFALNAKYHEKEKAQITAYVPDGYKFIGWTSDASEDIFEDSNSASTQICMPAYDVNITANIIECPRLVLSNITDSSVTVTARACENINSGVVILAVYDDNDVLKNVVTKNFEQSVTFDGLNLTGYTVKAMLWDDIYGMKPIAKSAEI